MKGLFLFRLKMLPFALLALASFAWAAGSASESGAGAATRRLEEHKAKAEKMAEHERAKIYAEICNDLAEIATEEFRSDNEAKAGATLKEIVSYSEKSTAAALVKGKHIKQAEILLRRCSHELDELAHTLGVDEQKPVLDTIHSLEQQRDRLMSEMFGAKKK